MIMYQKPKNAALKQTSRFHYEAYIGSELIGFVWKDQNYGCWRYRSVADKITEIRGNNTDKESSFTNYFTF